MDRLGNDDGPVFDVPTQHHLGRRDPVGLGYFLQPAATGSQVCASRQWRVCLDGYAMLLAEGGHRALLPAGVQFNLIHGRVLPRLLVQPFQMLRQEVADPQGPHPPLITQPMECAPNLVGTPIERCWPMDHIHVDIVSAQQCQLAVKGPQGAVIPLFGVTQLGSQPQLGTPRTALATECLEATTHAAFVEVARRRIDVAITQFQGGLHYSSGLIVVDPEHTQAHLRNAIAVRQ